MSGWDFLDAYQKLLKEQKENSLIFMLSTSLSQKDIERADKHPLVEKYITKPLTDEIMENILSRHFQNNI
jgi:hypothetical protein